MEQDTPSSRIQSMARSPSEIKEATLLVEVTVTRWSHSADNKEKECFYIIDEVKTEAVDCILCMFKSEQLYTGYVF